MAFRAASLLALTYLLKFVWIRALGGGYLLKLAYNYFFRKEGDQALLKIDTSGEAFWRIVLAVELVDIACSVDSILASVAVSDTYWIVLVGGVVGILMMRVAAGVFIGLLERWPGLERSAYLLISIVGARLLLQSIDPVLTEQMTNYFYAAMSLSLFIGVASKGEPSHVPL